jgi:hypothetical protein
MEKKYVWKEEGLNSRRNFSSEMMFAHKPSNIWFHVKQMVEKIDRFHACTTLWNFDSSQTINSDKWSKKSSFERKIHKKLCNQKKINLFYNFWQKSNFLYLIFRGSKEARCQNNQQLTQWPRATFEDN